MVLSSLHIPSVGGATFETAGGEATSCPSLEAVSKLQLGRKWEVTLRATQKKLLDTLQLFDSKKHLLVNIMNKLIYYFAV